MTDASRPDERPEDAMARGAHARLRAHDAASTPRFAAVWTRAQSRVARGTRRRSLYLALGASGAAAAAALLVVFLRPTSERAGAPPSAPVSPAVALTWHFPVAAPEPLAFLLELPRLPRRLEASR